MTRDPRSLDTPSLAKRLIGSEAGVQRWLKAGHPNLGWRRPADVLGSGPAGEAEVRALLLAVLERVEGPFK